MMTLHTFDIPEDDALLASWLEDMIAGPHLGELVSELEVLREAGRVDRDSQQTETHGPGQQTTLEQVLGRRREAVSQEGLAAVPAKSLRRLFRQPELLIALQDHVLTEGGAYWDRKLRESNDLSERTETGWHRLSESPVIGPPAVQPVRPARELRARPMRWFVAGLATAAAVAVFAVIGWDRMQGPQQVAKTGWGWIKPDAFPVELSREQYLKMLADEAEEWSRKRPDTPQDLAQRISEFREGCSRLILSEHKPLPPADRKWLVERCRVWAKKLDEQLADLEAGKTTAIVRAQVDETVDRLAKALRDRAAKPTPA
jgi:hypothetical protein